MSEGFDRYPWLKTSSAEVPKKAALSDADILPCPFCGHVGLNFREGSTFRWLEYYCGGCGTGNETRVQTLGEGTNEEWAAQAQRDAISEWNTRAADRRLTAEPVAVAEVIEADHYALEARIRWLLNPMPVGSQLFEIPTAPTEAT